MIKMKISTDPHPDSNQKGSEWVLIDETGDEDSDQGAWSSASSSTSGQGAIAKPTDAATTHIPRETHGAPRPDEGLDNGLTQTQKHAEGRACEPWPLPGASCWAPAPWSDAGGNVTSRREIVPKLPTRLKEAGIGGFDPITELMVLADVLNKVNKSVSAETEKGKGSGQGPDKGEGNIEERDKEVVRDQQAV